MSSSLRKPWPQELRAWGCGCSMWKSNGEDKEKTTKREREKGDRWVRRHVSCSEAIIVNITWHECGIQYFCPRNLSHCAVQWKKIMDHDMFCDLWQHVSQTTWFVQVLLRKASWLKFSPKWACYKSLDRRQPLGLRGIPNSWTGVTRSSSDLTTCL